MFTKLSLAASSGEDYNETMHDTTPSVRELAEKEVATRKQVHRCETLADLGFIGLIATELPEFIR